MAQTKELCVIAAGRTSRVQESNSNPGIHWDFSGFVFFGEFYLRAKAHFGLRGLLEAGSSGVREPQAIIS
eukprot:970293-Amorphochlora_amoeboformis.AAC.2